MKFAVRSHEIAQSARCNQLDGERLDWSASVSLAISTKREQKRATGTRALQSWLLKMQAWTLALQSNFFFLRVIS